MWTCAAFQVLSFLSFKLLLPPFCLLGLVCWLSFIFSRSLALRRRLEVFCLGEPLEGSCSLRSSFLCFFCFFFFSAFLPFSSCTLVSKRNPESMCESMAWQFILAPAYRASVICGRVRRFGCFPFFLLPPSCLLGFVSWLSFLFSRGLALQSADSCSVGWRCVGAWGTSVFGKFLEPVSSLSGTSQLIALLACPCDGFGHSRQRAAFAFFLLSCSCFLSFRSRLWFSFSSSFARGFGASVGGLS